MASTFGGCSQFAYASYVIQHVYDASSTLYSPGTPHTRQGRQHLLHHRLMLVQQVLFLQQPSLQHTHVEDVQHVNSVVRDSCSCIAGAWLTSLVASFNDIEKKVSWSQYYPAHFHPTSHKTVAGGVGRSAQQAGP